MQARTNQGFKPMLRACVLVLTVAVYSSATAQNLIWLGTLFRGGWSKAYDVSPDGRVVVGAALNPSYFHRAFRWTWGIGMEELGLLPGTDYSYALGVSADGNVVVGYAFNDSDYYYAFRWANRVMQNISGLGALLSWAADVSWDGSVVVGTLRGRAFRWHDGVMEDLGTFGGPGSAASAVSADGSVVVGWARDSLFQTRPFRWRDGVMEDLGTLGSEWGQALGVSIDGNVVVGCSGGRAFRWRNGVMEDLGTLGGGFLTNAYAVSVDGNLVIGTEQSVRHDRPAYTAFRWTPSGGIEDLNTVYAPLLSDGSSLWEARALSPDGRYIVGTGYNSLTRRLEAFLLDTWRTGDTNGDGCIDEADLLSVLLAFGTPGSGFARHEDMDKNGIVDDADLLIVLLNFGSGC